MIGSSIMNYHEIGMPFAKPTGFCFFSGKISSPIAREVFFAGYTTVGLYTVEFHLGLDFFLTVVIIGFIFQLIGFTMVISLTDGSSQLITLN
jgi:hypothetical protein